MMNKLRAVHRLAFKYFSISVAAVRPLAMARTTRLAPVAASPAMNTFSANTGCSGLRNPIANKTISASIISFFPVGFIIERSLTGSGNHSTSSTSTPVTLPFFPRNRLEVRLQRRIQPSSWLEVVFSTAGHCGHGVAGLWATGGLGMISICVTQAAP